MLGEPHEVLVWTGAGAGAGAGRGAAAGADAAWARSGWGQVAGSGGAGCGTGLIDRRRRPRAAGLLGAAAAAAASDRAPGRRLRRAAATGRPRWPRPQRPRARRPWPSWSGWRARSVILALTGPRPLPRLVLVATAAGRARPATSRAARRDDCRLAVGGATTPGCGSGAVGARAPRPARPRLRDRNAAHLLAVDDLGVDRRTLRPAPPAVVAPRRASPAAARPPSATAVVAAAILIRVELLVMAATIAALR